MATDLERLIVTLEASTKQYTNEIKKVRSDTNKMFQAMQGEITANSRRVESAFGQIGSRAASAFKESLMGIARGGIASLLGGFAFEKLADNIRESVKAVADLGDEAADLGVSSQSLQVFSRMAIEAGTDADQMAKALAQVAQQSQDTGSKMSKLFSTMGRTVTGDVTTDMLTLMNIIERMESPTQRLATLMDVFGAKLGRSLAESLTQGSQAYFETLHEMEREGDIYTDKQVKNARKIDAEWNTMMDHLGTQWHKFILESISDGEKLLDWMRRNRSDFQNWLIPPGGSERLKGLQRGLEQQAPAIPGYSGPVTNVPGNIQADFAEAVSQFKNLSTGLLAEVARQESHRRHAAYAGHGGRSRRQSQRHAREHYGRREIPLRSTSGVRRSETRARRLQCRAGCGQSGGRRHLQAPARNAKLCRRHHEPARRRKEGYRNNFRRARGPCRNAGL
jgi:hypothetical protein